MKKDCMKKISKSIIISAYLLFSNSVYSMDSNSNIKIENYNFKLEDKLQEIVTKTKQKYDIPGFSFAILLPNEKKPLAFFSGVTTIQNGKPISQETLFQVASVTKTFTAALLSQEIKNNSISLHDKLSNFLPQYPNWGNITVEQLETQTSGIFDYTQSENWWENLIQNKNKVWQPEELLNIAYKHPLNFKSGTAWAYSNTNYVLLGQVLQKVTSQSISSLMNKIIESNNLKNTYYLNEKFPANIAENVPHGYVFKNDMFGMNSSWLSSAGAIMSTPTDLTKWIKHLFEENNQLLNDKNKFASTENGKPVHSIEESSYSYGIFKINTPLGLIFFTPGLAPGFTSSIVYSPCLNIFFSYSANRSALRYFQGYMIKNVLGLFIENNDYKKYLEKNNLIPDYCKNIKPSADFNFPPIG